LGSRLASTDNNGVVRLMPGAPKGCVSMTLFIDPIDNPDHGWADRR
jgi:hypothetical protein